jgi:uncharacterized YkwD family protein/spore coat assembly protein SafA
MAGYATVARRQWIQEVIDIYKKCMAIIITSMMMFSWMTPAFAESQIYTVRAGDTLWRIAQKYQIGLSELIKANPRIQNAALIYTGQRIVIPEASPLETLEKQVATMVNRERASRGLSPLQYNWQLARVARIKSQEMADKHYFSHTSPTYGSPFRMMERFGLSFSAAGENIAMGQRTPAEVMSSWMNSAGHRSNILSSAYTEIGIGAAKRADGTLYWTQMFIRP